MFNQPTNPQSPSWREKLEPVPVIDFLIRRQLLTSKLIFNVGFKEYDSGEGFFVG